MLARSITNLHNYEPGFILASVKTLTLVKFDHSIAIPFDTNDIAAVVIDKDPQPKDLVIGAHVIAKRPKETSHVEGKVVKRKDENGERLYLIDFWDGVEHWNTSDKLRILTTIKPGGNYMDCFGLVCYSYEYEYMVSQGHGFESRSSLNFFSGFFFLSA